MSAHVKIACIVVLTVSFLLVLVAVCIIRYDVDVVPTATLNEVRRQLVANDLDVTQLNPPLEAYTVKVPNHIVTL